MERWGRDPNARVDRQYLSVLIKNYGGGAVGVGTLAASLSEDEETIEDVVEPYLMQIGFIQRTPKGRVATRRAFAHIGVKPSPAQGDLFA